MRTIKFRGKKPSNDVWMYGSLVLSDELDTAIYFQVGTAGVKQMEWVYVKPETVGQFTGLKDKNGREIYEGDIIFHYNMAYHIEYINGQWISVASDGGWLPLLQDQEPISDQLHYIEVVGNIHDNQELLKGGAQ